MDVVSNQTRQHIESYSRDKPEEIPDPEVGKWEQRIRVGTLPDMIEMYEIGKDPKQTLKEHLAEKHNYARALKCEVVEQQDRTLLVENDKVKFVIEDNRLYRVRDSVNVLGSANWDYLLKDNTDDTERYPEKDNEIPLERKREKAIKRNEFCDLIRDFIDEHGQIQVNESHPNAGKVEEEVVAYDYISPHTNKLIEVYQRRVHDVELQNKDTRREYEKTQWRIRVSSSGKSIIFGNYDKGRSEMSKKRYYLPIKQLMPYINTPNTTNGLYFKEVGSQDETDFKLFTTKNGAVGIEMPNGAVLWTNLYALNQIINGKWDGQRGIGLSAEC